MNLVLKEFDIQRGIDTRNSRDFVLKRLCVRQEDSWRGIVPSTLNSDYNPEPPILAAKFANEENNKHILAIANEDGKIALQDTSKPNRDGEEKALDGPQCHFNAVFDLEWVPGQMKFVSASGDHTSKLWDICESEIRQSRVFTGHTRSVKTAAFRKRDSSVFATGGRDGAILIWDTRAQPRTKDGADNCIYSGHAGGPSTPNSQRKRIPNQRTPKLSSNVSSSSITGLVFQDDSTLISCGAGDGIIKVWDLRRYYTTCTKEPLPRYSLPYAGTSSTYKAFTCLVTDKAGLKLYANCMDHSIYCYNLVSYSSTPIMKYTGLQNSTFYIKSCLSPDEEYLISGSSNEKAFIWNVNKPEPIVSLNGHCVEVTCVAWGEKFDQPIVTCSDDARHKIWRIGPEFIDDCDKNFYRGQAEECKQHIKSESSSKPSCRLKELEFTPKSLKRLVEINETTPSAEKLCNKRSYFDMIDSEAGCSKDLLGSETKRIKVLETKGRRLFSPSTSSCLGSEENSISGLLHLASIKEENEYSSPVRVPLTSNAALIFSPTQNLPNYVIDGEAPHLGVMSPKKRSSSRNDNIDWLTRIRKQKLMCSKNNQLICDIKTSSTDNDMGSNIWSLSDALETPNPLQKRLSQSGHRSPVPSSSSSSPASRTPSSRRKSESILRFFAKVTTPTSKMEN